ncbi:MAG: hypothetical protein Q8N96_02575 [Methylovulum sp.]|nr:hypothetical protein [Methylovulum sp.]
MKLIKYIPLLAALVAPSMVNAAAPLAAGQWKAQFYNADGIFMFDAGVCFQRDRTWHMTTQFYSAGHWELVGNNIRIHGGNDNSNGAGELVRLTPRFMAGPWQSWTDDDMVNMDLVSRWEFTKPKCDPPAPAE